ncbi:MAG: TIGR00730 family Rossman fold protein [Anaerolineaceae bacterium]|nr:TIGR00730 family Rossman fold protein [Anaerolineaceae bacterium]
MKRICVYCGSSPGANQAYTIAAHALGKVMTDQGIGLVYGGGSVGLMGQIAQSVADHGGEVIGIIPRDLDFREVSNRSLTDLRIVGSMHERKAMMEELSDGFIAMPGGYGTLDEVFEILTWSQLGLHHKPIGFLNVNGYYENLLAFLDHVKQEQFIEEAFRQLILTAEEPLSLIDQMNRFDHPKVDKAKLALKKNKK